jgi:hypothetical protein
LGNADQFLLLHVEAALDADLGGIDVEQVRGPFMSARLAHVVDAPWKVDALSFPAWSAARPTERNRSGGRPGRKIAPNVVMAENLRPSRRCLGAPDPSGGIERRSACRSVA